MLAMDHVALDDGACLSELSQGGRRLNDHLAVTAAAQYQGLHHGEPYRESDAYGREICSAKRLRLGELGDQHEYLNGAAVDT